jgi:deoxyribodipyrimidine photo-lyase
LETKKLSVYKLTRNGLVEPILVLSSHLVANGTLSPRRIYWEILNYEEEIEKTNLLIG